MSEDEVRFRKLLDAVIACRKRMDEAAQYRKIILDPTGDTASTFRHCAGMLQDVIEANEIKAPAEK